MKLTIDLQTKDSLELEKSVAKDLSTPNISKAEIIKTLQGIADEDSEGNDRRRSNQDNK